MLIDYNRLMSFLIQRRSGAQKGYITSPGSHSQVAELKPDPREIPGPIFSYYTKNCSTCMSLHLEGTWDTSSLKNWPKYHINSSPIELLKKVQKQMDTTGKFFYSWKMSNEIQGIFQKFIKIYILKKKTVHGFQNILHPKLSFHSTFYRFVKAPL